LAVTLSCLVWGLWVCSEEILLEGNIQGGYLENVWEGRSAPSPCWSTSLHVTVVIWANVVKTRDTQLLTTVHSTLL